MKRLSVMALFMVSLFFISSGNKRVEGFIKEINGENYVVQTEDGNILTVKLEGAENLGINKPQICDGVTLDMKGSKVDAYWLNPLAKGWVVPLSGTDKYFGIKFSNGNEAKPLGKTLAYEYYERGDGYITVVSVVPVNNKYQKVFQKWDIISITRDVLKVNIDGKPQTFKAWDKKTMKINN